MISQGKESESVALLSKDDGLHGKHASINGNGSKDDTEENEKVKGKCNCCSFGAQIAGALFNVINGIIGAGILGFPYAYYAAGITTTTIVTMTISILCLTSLFVVIFAARESGATSYQDIMKYYYKKPGKLAGEFFVIFYMEGACIVYLTVISQSIMPVVGEINFGSTDSFVGQKWFIIFVFSLVFIFPLSLLREIGFLSPTSFVAFISAVYLVFLVTIMAIVNQYFGDIPSLPSKHSTDFFIFNRDTIGGFPFFFLAVPIVSFAFQCHGVCIPIFSEFYKTEKKSKGVLMITFLIIAVLAIIIVSTLYYMIGISGFINYQNHTLDNILLNYPSSPATIIARVAVGATATFSYPVQCFTAKLVIQSFLFGGKKMGTWTFLAISLIQFVLNVVLAIAIPSLSTVFGFVGSIGCPFLMFIFPAMMILKMSCFKGRFMCFLKWVLIPVYMLLGIVFCLAGVVVTIFKVINSSKV